MKVTLDDGDHRIEVAMPGKGDPNTNPYVNILAKDAGQGYQQPVNLTGEQAVSFIRLFRRVIDVLVGAS